MDFQLKYRFQLTVSENSQLELTSSLNQLLSSKLWRTAPASKWNRDLSKATCLNQLRVSVKWVDKAQLDITPNISKCDCIISSVRHKSCQRQQKHASKNLNAGLVLSSGQPKISGKNGTVQNVQKIQNFDLKYHHGLNQPEKIHVQWLILWIWAGLTLFVSIIVVMMTLEVQ